MTKIAELNTYLIGSLTPRGNQKASTRGSRGFYPAPHSPTCDFECQIENSNGPVFSFQEFLEPPLHKSVHTYDDNENENTDIGECLISRHTP